MYTIHEVCEKTGLSAYTLRYYEKEKLLPSVSRSAGGFRQYSEEDVQALEMICRLKSIGMSLQDISRFMTLFREGDKTLGERCEMLRRHRDAVIVRLEDMKKQLDIVKREVDFFSEKLEEYEQKKKA